MKSESFVSIIIPTYNRAKMLGITLGSFIKQEYSPDSFEIIVVDNNSADHTCQVVKQFAGLARIPIRYVFEKRQGVHFARNTAAKLAIGDILYFTDDDMIADPFLLREIVRPFQLDEMVGVVTGKVLPRWEVPPPAWLEKMCSNGWLSLNDQGDDMRIENFDLGVYSCHQAMRREVFFATGGFHPENTAGEWIGDGETGLNERIRAQGRKFAYNGKSVIYHMIPPGRMTQSYLNRRLANQGNADSYADFRRHHSRRPTLFLKALGHLRPMGVRLREVIVKTLKNAWQTIFHPERPENYEWHLDCAYVFYHWARLAYDLRLLYSERWRKLVLTDDWLKVGK